MTDLPSIADPDLLDRIVREAAGTTASAATSADPLPFEEVLQPAVSVARRELAARAGPMLLDLLGEAARGQLERGLLIDLTNLCAAALEQEFDAVRPAGPRLLALSTGASDPAGSRDHYLRFVSALLADGGLAFFGRWPVLARLVAVIVESWVAATHELLLRFAADLPLLREVTATSADQVISIATHCSDRHHGGRTVLILELDSGPQVVYKPRSLELEAGFYRLLAWCNDRAGLPHSFRVLWALDRGDYGWMEHAEAGPCADSSAVARFYERAGMLLALVYALRGTDCHFENVIAAEDHPLLIDAEALFHPDMRPSAMGAEADAGASPAEESFRHSVLRTGLLPQWDLSSSGAGEDVSALCAGTGSLDGARALRWVAVNTDAMHRALRPRLPRRHLHLPELDGQSLAPDDHLASILAGFASMVRFLIDARADLLAPSGPLQSFRQARPRFVFRVTQLYSDVQARSLAPAKLRRGVDRSIELELLCRAFLLGDERPPAWPILAAELEACEQLDVPHFHALASSTALYTRRGLVVPDFFEVPPFADVERRLATLDEADLALQQHLVRGAFQARSARPPHGSARGRGADDAEVDRIEPLSTSDFLEEAIAIGRDLVRRSVRGENGSATWIGLLHESLGERYQLRPLGARLYDGSTGVALFLAALAESTGDDELRDLALGALRPLRDFLRSAAPPALARFARDLGLGGATGLGSLIYALVRTGDRLGCEDLIEDARRVADLITDDLLRGDRHLDVTGGVAGAALGLLALHDRTGDPLLLDRAVACGRRLLDRRVSVRGGPRAWCSIEPEPLTGFGHGAAGIAYALLRLSAVSGDAELRDAAVEGIAYERGLFDAALGNWPDLRHSAAAGELPWHLVNWCHGAAGIGLARLGALAILDTAEIRADIDAALDTTKRWGAQDVDHLCCGNAGRAELFLTASEVLGRPEHRARAARHATWIARRARESGGYRLFPDLADHVFSPGFFQGTAGIGYLFLRLARGPELPSVLLWQ